MAEKRLPTIALLTDFGTRDAYAGIVRGVLANRAPEARVIDLTHEIPAGDVRAAALHLWQSHAYLPAGTIFLLVVDPGVGTARRPIAVRLPNGYGVGPDNGVFSYLMTPDTTRHAVVIDVSRLTTELPSLTFHGRDIFAPAAARLAQGAPLSDLGPPARELVTLPAPRLDMTARGATGEVLWIDSFGNALTSVGKLRVSGPKVELQPCWHLGSPVSFRTSAAVAEIGARHRLPLSGTYAEVPAGEPLAYIGSSGLLEIAVHGGRADEVLGLAPGIPVTLVFEG
ncbi:MAG: SAM-dependent chlorinase/fluorinase [Chloroflexi bacterium]|jgi:S-adenosylmethionine hydrolase|nr:SAM-dependent chlorinase/fluorinase [Chloroflexota bacterium]